MVKKSLLWFYRVTLFALWLTIIVLASAVLSMRYLVLPHIDEYKPAIEQRISAAMGQKVTIGNIRASWDRLNPRLSLQNVQVYDKQQRPALALGHVATSLSWLSIPLLEPRLSRLIIYEPSLTVRREADGTIYVAGIAVGGEGRSGFSNWLLRQSQIDVIDASVLWQDELRKAPALTLNNLNLRVVSPAWESLAGHHRFGLHATPSAGSSQLIDIRGDVYGKDAGQWQKWHGTIYARLEGTDISAWRNWVDYPFDLREGFGAAQLWLDFSEGKPQQLTADVILNNVAMRVSTDSPEAALQTLSGRLGWTRLPDGHQLQAQHIKMVTADGLNMQDGNGSVSQRTVDGKKRTEGEVTLDETQLQSLMAFAAYLPVPEETKLQLSEISPVGRLQQLKMSWTSTGKAMDAYNFSSRFAQLGMQPYQRFPGFSNLSGSIKATETGGTVTLDSREATVELKEIFRRPLPADKLSGVVRWQRDNDKTDIRLNNIAVENAHLAGSVNGQYVHDGDAGGMLDLKASLNRADARFAPNYYPLILGEKTLQWLDTSILAGHSEAVSVIVKGPLKAFPFPDNKHGMFQVKAHITDGVLAFSEEWPQLEKLSLDLLFEGARMEINADQGSTLGNRILPTKVVIPALDADDPIVQVTGDAQGTVADGLHYLERSPLQEHAGEFIDGLQAAGNGKLHLELKLPIKHVADTQVKGHYTVANGNMGGPNLPQLTRINGKLEFTESVLSAQKVNAWLYGGPLQFNLLSSEGVLRVAARGIVTDSGLREVIGSRLSDLIVGSTEWDGDIRAENGQTDITIRSSLEGMASSLPEPLGKIPAEQMPLVIARSQQSPEQDLIKVSLGEELSAILQRSEQSGALQVERGEVGINVAPEIPQHAGIGVRGKLNRLDLDEWRILFDKPESNEQSAGQDSAGSQDARIAIDRINLDVDVLDVFDRRINDLKLQAQAENENWRMEIKSREITGNAQWLSQGDGKIIAKLQNFIVPGAAPGTAELRAQGEFKQATQRYPALDIVADNFELGQKKLGKLELQASEQESDWRIDKLRISNTDSVLDADGVWRNWKRRPHTLLNLDWKISDIGKTLERFGYPGIIKGGKSELSGKLGWRGSPTQFEIPGLAGNLKLSASNGQILQLKPGVGRLFSVVSLQNLPRRLTFDFRDVFNRGFLFDAISANVNIDNGVMHSENFRMEGPAALVQIKGKTDLAKETQHLLVKVTPYISDSVALAALAGGPVVGAAAYITQKLLKDPLDKIVAREYEITGTWDDPVVKKGEAEEVAPGPSPLSNDQ